MHLDMIVDDLDAAEAAVIDIGATKHPDQPGASFRVFLDPALVGLSWAMEPSKLSLSWNRSSESSSTATGIVRLAIELGGRHQIGH